MMGHSERCFDLTTHWDSTKQRCVPCDLPKAPGKQVTPNCGYDDDGGLHEPATEWCGADTFNDGSTALCRPCTACASANDTVRACNRTHDTVCREASASVTHTYPPRFQNDTGPLSPSSHHHVLWVVPVAIIITVVLAVICLKWKKGQWCFQDRSSLSKAGFSFLLSSSCTENEDVLSPVILSAPLQTVLDQLDTLEELVILLDPEVRGVKNTKHLASLCSFPSTWVTYTYSMRESKSPLKAVLEGVTSRQPDWTVGHLADMLKRMERNDAIAVLAKLQLNKMHE